MPTPHALFILCLVLFCFVFCTHLTGRGTCNDDQFMCENGQCIRYSWQCDGMLDCDDGSDETVDNHCGEPLFHINFLADS